MQPFYQSNFTPQQSTLKIIPQNQIQQQQQLQNSTLKNINNPIQSVVYNNNNNPVLNFNSKNQTIKSVNPSFFAQPVQNRAIAEQSVSFYQPKEEIQQQQQQQQIYNQDNNYLRSFHQNSDFEDDDLNYSQSENTKSKQKVYILSVLLFCPILYVIIIFFAAFFMLTSHFTSKKTLENSEFVLHNVYQNLNRNPINFISSSENDCIDGSEQALIQEWKGVQKGCICSDGKVHSIEHCQLNYNECSLIGQYDSQNLYLWRDSQKICVKHNKQWSQQSKCQQNQNQCFQNICTQQQEQCPDSSIDQFGNGKKMFLQSMQSLLEDQKFAHQNSFKVDDFLFTSQYDPDLQETGTPIVQILATTGLSPCLNPQLSPAQPTQKAYPLLNQKPAGCDQYGDLSPYTEVISQMSAQEFYKINNMQKIFNQITYFDDYQSKQDKIYLLGLKRIRVQPSEQCQSVMSENFTEVKNFSGFGRGVLSFFIIILFILTLISIVIGTLFVLRKSNFIPVRFEDQPFITLQSFYYLTYIIAFFSIFIGIFYYFAFSSGISTIINRMKYYISNNCFSDQGINLAINKVINYNQETSDVYASKIHTIVYCSIIFLIFWLILRILKKQPQFSHYLPGSEIVVKANPALP